MHTISYNRGSNKRLFRGEHVILKFEKSEKLTFICIESSNFACDKIKVSFIENIPIEIGDKIVIIKRLDGQWISVGEGMILE